jgi:DNA-binding NtrC family response regulator
MDRRTVLLVDQNESVLNRLVEIVTAAGHTAVPCRSFEEGRRYLRRETPHAIVTELRLGAFNGLHLVLLARQNAPEIAAVVYSGHADSGMRSDAVSGGASYLDRDTLLANLMPHLNARLPAMPAGPCTGPDVAVAPPG